MRWALSYTGAQPPMFMFAPKIYAAAFPRAKSLVGAPMARFRGVIAVDGEEHAVDGWVGSQNHNWGSRHTDRYAYGQVCGFDNAPDSFLEVATARVRLGPLPLLTPPITPLTLRHDGAAYKVDTLWQGLRASGRCRYFDWRFSARVDETLIEGAIHAPREAFVGLRYYNPPGGDKFCLNSKIAACRLTLRRSGRAGAVLETQNRAAFEILTDDQAHGVAICA